MVTSASVSGRRKARCPNAVMNALPLARRVGGRVRRNQARQRGRVARHLVRQRLGRVEKLRPQLLGHVQRSPPRRRTRSARRPTRCCRWPRCRRQLQQVPHRVRPLLPAEAREPRRRDQHRRRRRRRDGVGVAAEAGRRRASPRLRAARRRAGARPRAGARRTRAEPAREPVCAEEPFWPLPMVPVQPTPTLRTPARTPVAASLSAARDGGCDAWLGLEGTPHRFLAGVPRGRNLFGVRLERSWTSAPREGTYPVLSAGELS